MEQLLGSLDSLIVKIDALPAPEDPLLEELLAFLECFHRTERNRPTTTAAQAEEFGRLVIEAGAGFLPLERTNICVYVESMCIHRGKAAVAAISIYAISG